MKLYTEEQVRKAMLIYHNGLTLEYVLSQLTPIEPPSDEEISTVGTIVYGGEKAAIHDILQYKAFKRGAKYIINRIQGGNNE